MRKTLIISGWLISSVMTLATTISTLYFLNKPQYQSVYDNSISGILHHNILAYNLPSDNTTSLSFKPGIQDARSIIIEKYFSRYGSPMSGYGQLIVETADALETTYNLDGTHLAFITVAIAQAESNLGKKMPPNCHNAWGWGIHSAGTLCFENWHQGITTYMTGLGKDYMHNRGLISPEEIMSVYVPHSPNGAWAKNVNQFLHQIHNVSF